MSLLVSLVCSLFVLFATDFSAVKSERDAVRYSDHLHERLSKLINLAQVDADGNPFPIVECSINDSPFLIRVRTDWAPIGAERFVSLVNDGYYNNCALFRAIKNFIVQFGLANNDELRQKWKGQRISDDTGLPKIPFEKGVLSYAGGGMDTRTTQIFFALAHSDWLGREPWETPFAEIVENLEVLDTINTEYDDNPNQGKIWQEGYEYLRREFPNLTYLDYCREVNIKAAADDLHVAASADDVIHKKHLAKVEDLLAKANDVAHRKGDQMAKEMHSVMDKYGITVYMIEIFLIGTCLIVALCFFLKNKNAVTKRE